MTKVDDLTASRERPRIEIDPNAVPTAVDAERYPAGACIDVPDCAGRSGFIGWTVVQAAMYDLLPMRQFLADLRWVAQRLQPRSLSTVASYAKSPASTKRGVNLTSFIIRLMPNTSSDENVAAVAERNVTYANLAIPDRLLPERMCGSWHCGHFRPLEETE